MCFFVDGCRVHFFCYFHIHARLWIKLTAENAERAELEKEYLFSALLIVHFVALFEEKLKKLGGKPDRWIDQIKSNYLPIP